MHRNTLAALMSILAGIALCAPAGKDPCKCNDKRRADFGVGSANSADHQ